MLSLLRSLFASSLLLLLSTQASAQGLLQFTLKGEVSLPGGGWCELAVSAQGEQGSARRVDLGLHLGAGTKGIEVLQLLAARLEREGVVVVRPVWGARSEAATGSLWIEQCQGLSVRVPEGLQATVVVSESAPQSVRVVPAGEVGGQLLLTATTRNRTDGTVGRLTCQVPWTAKSGKDDIATALAARAIDQGWRGEVTGRDTWQPGLLIDGAELRGVSLELIGAAGATLELALPKR